MRYRNRKWFPDGLSKDGFTLLELLISMTIMAMIVVIIFGGFRVGVRAWEKGESSVAGRQRQRIVLDLIRHQLASICAAEVRDPEGEPVRFKGNRTSMAFVSHLALVPGPQAGPAYVQYAVQKNAGDETVRLAFYERAATSPEMETDPEGGFYELLSGVKSIAFEYLKIRTDETESPWQESWDAAFDRGLPQAIRITLLENEDKSPVYVIAAAGM